MRLRIWRKDPGFPGGTTTDHCSFPPLWLPHSQPCLPPSRLPQTAPQQDQLELKCGLRFPFLPTASPWLLSHLLSLSRRFSNPFLLFLILTQTLGLPQSYPCSVPCSLGSYVQCLMFTGFVCSGSCSLGFIPLFLLIAPWIPLFSTGTAAWHFPGSAEHVFCTKPCLFCLPGSLEV